MPQGPEEAAQLYAALPLHDDAISDIFLLLDGSAAAKQKENELWAYLKAHTSAGVYRSIRYGFGGVTNLKIPKGDKLVLGGYRIAQKIFKFN